MSLRSPLSPNEEILPTTPTTTKNQPPLTKTQEAELKSYLVSFTQFDTNFTKLKTDVDYLESSIERLKAKLRQPLAIAKQKVKLLSRQQQASQQLVNLIKFCELAAKLGDSEKSQFNAKFIKEIDELILLEDLEDFEIVKKSSNMINLKKEKAFDDADKFLINGMQNQDQVEIVNALNITYYLNTLLPTIKSLYEQMEQQINNSIVSLFGFKAHPPGMPQFWDNFESSFNFIADELIKISILQTVLQKQKVPETNELYLDLIEKNLSYENLVSSLWSSFNNQLRSIVENLNKKNPNLHKLILDNYPKLISLIYQFLQKLAIKTSYYNDPQVQSVEKLTLMNSFSNYEQEYLKASYQRILKPVNLAFPSNTREIATRNDIGYLIRLMAKELDLVQLDTNLIEGVTQNIEKSIRIIHSRCSSMIIRDSSAYFIPNFSSLLTSSNSSQQLLKQSQSLTDSQQRNLDLALCLGHLYLQIKKSLIFKNSENLINLVNPVIETNLQKLSELIDNIIQPLSNKVQEDLEKMFLNLHQSNYRKVYNKKQDDGTSQISIFMVELLTKGNWIKLNLWQKLLVGIIDTKVATIIHKLCERIVKLYLRHAGSIILSNDQSRFIFTSDMTELEFMLNNWLESAINNKSKLLLKPGLKQSLVIDFSNLKVFRRLIFTETKELKSNLEELEKLPIQVVIPHFLTRLTPRFTIFQASDLSPQAYSSNVDKLYKDEIKGFYQKAMKSKMTTQYREKLKDLDLEEIDRKNNELVFELVEGFLN